MRLVRRGIGTDFQHAVEFSRIWRSPVRVSRPFSGQLAEPTCAWGAGQTSRPTRTRPEQAHDSVVTPARAGASGVPRTVRQRLVSWCPVLRGLREKVRGSRSVSQTETRPAVARAVASVTTVAAGPLDDGDGALSAAQHEEPAVQPVALRRGRALVGDLAVVEVGAALTDGPAGVGLGDRQGLGQQVDQRRRLPVTDTDGASASAAASVGSSSSSSAPPPNSAALAACTRASSSGPCTSAVSSSASVAEPPGPAVARRSPPRAPRSRPGRGR